LFPVDFYIQGRFSVFLFVSTGSTVAYRPDRTGSEHATAHGAVPIVF